MIRKSIVICFCIIICISAFSQVRIKMQKDGGVYKIPCVVNGLKLKFIFDTGASNVCISLSEANLMLENGYLDKSDIVGFGKSQIADGSIINNTKIIIRELEINGLFLKDVEAVVINELKAPLLLGLSAIEKLGKIQIEGEEIVVLNAKGNSYTNEELEKLGEQASIYFKDKSYLAAARTFQKIYDINRLNSHGVWFLAKSYFYLNDYQKALNYYTEIVDEDLGESDDVENTSKFQINLNMGICYQMLNNLDEALVYMQMAKPYMRSNSEKSFYYAKLVDLYAKRKDCNLLKENITQSLIFLGKDSGFEFEDIVVGKANADDVSMLLYLFAYNFLDCDFVKEGYSFMIVSAKYGFQEAIDYCKQNKINFGGFFGSSQKVVGSR